MSIIFQTRDKRVHMSWETLKGRINILMYKKVTGFAKKVFTNIQISNSVILVPGY